jgi:solute carrier family 12 sodium/potassium/chloride transporter 2
VVALALGSGAAGLFVAPTLHTPVLVGRFTDADPFTTFSIFFPAVTGIMVGAGMSGSLADPRKAIPRGTLAAWGLTAALYAVFVLWYGAMGSPEDLIANKTLMIDRALVPQLVLGGLLASTLMAALSSLVAAPRLLQAMAEHGVVPGSAWLRKTTAAGDPRNAVIATTGLAALGLAAGSLDAIAPIITSFFIMTYLAINGVVYLEQVLGMVSFRPAYQVPPWSPLLGVALCLGALAVASPFGGVLELLLVLGIYGVLTRRQLDTPWETVRSGIAVTLASWAARRAAHIERSERAWKPDMLVPVATAQQTEDLRWLCEPLARRNGSLRWVGLGTRDELGVDLPRVIDEERDDGLHTTWTRLHTDQYMAGVGLALDALRGALFPPNLVVVDERKVNDGEIASYLDHCRRLGVGMALWQPHPGDAVLGERAAINVWISDRSPDWKLELHVTNLDLPVLVGYLLTQQWHARLRLVTAVRDPSSAEAARRFLLDLIDQARLPAGTEIYVGTGPFLDELRQAPDADVHIFGMPPTIAKDRLAQVRTTVGASCLWLLDSGNESALA